MAVHCLFDRLRVRIDDRSEKLKHAHRNPVVTLVYLKLLPCNKYEIKTQFGLSAAHLELNMHRMASPSQAFAKTVSGCPTERTSVSSEVIRLI